MGYISRGSEWRKWDLHIHTPDTKLADQYRSEDNDKWDKFCQILNDSDVSAFGITDYFSIENYLLFVDKYKSTYHESDKVFFPNVEFRIDSKNKDNEHIQLHVIFSNKERIVEKIPNFFNRLALISTDDTPLTSKYCNNDDLNIVGYNKAMVKIDALVNQLESDFSKEEYLIVGLARGYGSLRPGRNDSRGGEYAKELDKKFDLFFGNSEDVDFYLNKVDGRSHYNLKKKPIIQGCDAHSFEDLILKLGKQHEKKDSNDNIISRSEVMWIKADLTFEGLRQIIYEPDQKIRIQPNEPDFKEDKLIIDEVQYYSNNNLFTPEKIRLNRNLNVIIGGKSSGKSILLYLIAATLETDTEVTSITNDKYNFRLDNDDFNFEVKSLSGVSQKLFDEKENSIIPNIKYIPQNYLTKLAEPEANKKGEELLKYVRGLLLEDEDYNNYYYKDFLSRVKLNDKKREDLIDNYFLIKENISNKEKELKEKGSEEVLNKSVESNLLKIAELKKATGLSEEQIAQYNSEKVKLEKVQSERIKISNDYRKVANFNREILNTLIELKNKKAGIEKSIETESAKTLFIQKYDFLNVSIGDLETFGQSLELVDNKLEKDSLFKQMLIDNSEEDKRLKKILEPLIKNEKIKTQISEIDKIVINDRKKLQSISQLKNELKNSKEELEKEKNKLFELYEENFEEYPKIISTLNDRTKLLDEQNLEIIGVPKFNSSKFTKNFWGMSDGRSFPEKEYSIFQNKEGLINFRNETELIEIKTLFEKIINNEFPLNSKTSTKSAIKILLDDYFVDYWETEYDGDKMGEMSTGKASFVILMLIVGLSSSKAPILIDQPEDNLDNRSITKDLVKYLRDKKIERQIILVTHNPNIVVNADAENIIVANQKGQNDKETNSPYKFDYINGAIEFTKDYDDNEKDLLKSMGIREHIADIVEGGKEAFKKREVKYGF